MLSICRIFCLLTLKTHHQPLILTNQRCVFFSYNSSSNRPKCSGLTEKKEPRPKWSRLQIHTASTLTAAKQVMRKEHWIRGNIYWCLPQSHISLHTKTNWGLQSESIIIKLNGERNRLWERRTPVWQSWPQFWYTCLLSREPDCNLRSSFAFIYLKQTNNNKLCFLYVSSYSGFKELWIAPCILRRYVLTLWNSSCSQPSHRWIHLYEQLTCAPRKEITTQSLNSARDGKYSNSGRVAQS